jgi:endoglucanase
MKGIFTAAILALTASQLLIGGATQAASPSTDPFDEVRAMGRGINVLGYDPLWKDATQAKVRAPSPA